MFQIHHNDNLLFFHVWLSQVERLLKEYTKNIRRMEERVREAEIQAGDAATQVARSGMRERQMVAEREGLLVELARSNR